MAFFSSTKSEILLTICVLIVFAAVVTLVFFLLGGFHSDGSVFSGSLLVSGYNEAVAAYKVNGTSLEKEREIQVGPNLSWLEVTSTSVYGIHEWGVPDGPLARFNIQDGSWSKQESLKTGSGPAHIHLNKDHGVIYVSNYGEGSFAAVRLQGEKLHTIIYNETFGDGCRDASHVHQAITRGKFIWVVDLGCDSVYHYEYNQAEEVVKTGVTTITEGGGPRHMALHPTRQLAFLVLELKSQVEVHSFDEESGKLKLVQKVSLVDRPGVNYGAEVLVHPSGGFVYVSSRGEEGGVVVVYQLLGSRLERIQEMEISGTWPRGMALSPHGELLAVADQRGNKVQVFSVDVSSGRLSPGDAAVETPAGPAYVTFM